ncbi:hypothetical protein FRC03_002632 [Tulasnella sp. 419]|nr:hypothetical protein FRC02_004960 [Tulasnella sp. 418]KAG8963732.1 hypothetical protein FRC03_002632 [Tulasnella sp. 419]
MFPTEIYQLIIEHVVKGKDLCSMARASTLLQLEAERVIYKFICPGSTLQFCQASRSILKNQHRHPFVQTLIVQPRFQFGRHDWDGIDASSLRRLAARLLRVATQLKVIKLSTFPAWVFWRANNPLLRTLEIQLPTKGSGVHQGDDNVALITSYLQRHPAITNVAFHRLLGRSLVPDTRLLAANYNKPEHLLPSLHTLSYTGPCSLHLLQDKQLSRVCLSVPPNEPIDEMNDIISIILGMGSTLLVLDLVNLRARDLDNQDVARIACSLPLLRYLGLPIYEDPDPEHDRARDDEFISIIQSHLPELVILFLGYGYDQMTSIGSRYHLVHRLLRARESLKCIITSSATFFDTTVHRRRYPTQLYNAEKHLALGKILSDLGIVLYEECYMGRYISFS